MSWVNRIAHVLLENLNGLTCLAGACWLYGGVAGFSRPAANVVAGALLLTIGAFPYVTRYLNKRKP